MSPAPERSRARNQESRTPASRMPARSRARHMGLCARHIGKVPRSGESIADDAPTSPCPPPPKAEGGHRWRRRGSPSPPPSAARRESQASGASARRLRDNKERRRGPGRGGGVFSLASHGAILARTPGAVHRTMVRAGVPFPKFVCMLWGRRAVSPTDHSHTPSCPDLPGLVPGIRASPEPGPPDAGQTRGWPERVRP